MSFLHGGSGGRGWDFQSMEHMGYRISNNLKTIRWLRLRFRQQNNTSVYYLCNIAQTWWKMESLPGMYHKADRHYSHNSHTWSCFLPLTFSILNISHEGTVPKGTCEHAAKYGQYSLVILHSSGTWPIVDLHFFVKFVFIAMLVYLSGYPKFVCCWLWLFVSQLSSIFRHFPTIFSQSFPAITGSQYFTNSCHFPIFSKYFPHICHGYPNQSVLIRSQVSLVAGMQCLLVSSAWVGLRPVRTWF